MSWFEAAPYGGQELSDWFRRKREATEANWLAAPIPHPTYDERPLQIGDRVRIEPDYAGRDTGIVTTIRVRCYGDPRTEEVKGTRFEVIGMRPSQQVWIELDGDSRIFYPEDILEVLTGD